MSKNSGSYQSARYTILFWGTTIWSPCALYRPQHTSTIWGRDNRTATTTIHQQSSKKRESGIGIEVSSRDAQLLFHSQYERAYRHVIFYASVAITWTGTTTTFIMGRGPRQGYESSWEVAPVSTQIIQMVPAITKCGGAHEVLETSSSRTTIWRRLYCNFSPVGAPDTIKRSKFCTSVPINQAVYRTGQNPSQSDLLPTQAYGFGTHDSIVRTYTVQTGPRVLLWYTVFTILFPFRITLSLAVTCRTSPSHICMSMFSGANERL
jgi:hypothetical protein